MGAVRVAGNAYITKGPPWAYRFSGLKLGRLGFPPGKVPAHLAPYLLKKGDVSPIVSECRSQGKGGVGLVECIFKGVAARRRKR